MTTAVFNGIVTSPKNGVSITGTMKVANSKPIVLSGNLNDKRERLSGFLRDISVKDGTSYQEMFETIKCESNFQTDIYGDDGRSFGVAQFLKTTFNENCVGEYENPYDQLTCMSSMFKRGMQSRWTCHRNLFGA